MSDIQFRFNKDMLVMSTSFDCLFKEQGFCTEEDRLYVALCEPELIEESFRLEHMIGTPCFVTATEGMTRARLAHANFENSASDMARIAYESASRFSPEHIFATIGPSGLPLDSSSAASLKQSRKQYQDATQELSAYPFDAIYFSSFARYDDALCALMGARAVYDGVVMLSFNLDENSQLQCGTPLDKAVTMADEYGADVIGFSSSLDLKACSSVFDTLKRNTSKPLLCEIEINQKNPRQLYPTNENPYPNPDTMVDAAFYLHDQGVQFIRASKNATLSYTGALVAATMGLDVRI